MSGMGRMTAEGTRTSEEFAAAKAKIRARNSPP
jgi:hypothetical protein